MLPSYDPNMMLRAEMPCRSVISSLSTVCPRSVQRQM